MRQARRKLIAALLLMGCATTARAQQQMEVIDRVVAVVGSRIILLSEIDEDINQRRSAGLQIPEDPAGLERLRREVLGSLVDNEVIYQVASRDTTIQVTDAEVQQGVSEQYRQIRAQFRSDADMQRALVGSGFTSIDEWRRWISEFQRKDLYRQRYFARMRQEGRLRGGAVPEEEIRQAYQAALTQAGAERPRRPATIAFRQISIAPQPTEAARSAALIRAESVRVELARGADFSAAARRFSSDASAAQGGDLGWFRREAMVREFADVAFNLRPGVASPVVRTAFGYHIIMVDRIQPAEVKARHILFAPEVTEADVAAARARAESLAVLVRGGASADSLARIYGDSLEPRFVGPVERTQLDSTFAAQFVDATLGQVIGPFAASPDGSLLRLRVVVAQLTEVEESREFTFEEVRERIRLQLQQQRAVANLMTTLRQQIYVDIRL